MLNIMATNNIESEAAAVSCPLSPAMWTVSLMGRVVDRMRLDFESRVSHLGLRSKQYSVLLQLRSGPLSQADIGRCARVDRTTMVALVDELEALGLVERARHAEDRRAHAVTLTERGRAVECEAARAVDETEAACFAPLTPEERSQLRELLSKLL
jgi:DNA-binding MarR family transcriptional regulator